MTGSRARSNSDNSCKNCVDKHRRTRVYDLVPCKLLIRSWTRISTRCIIAPNLISGTAYLLHAT
jgi:hypothetical protein